MLDWVWPRSAQAIDILGYKLNLYSCTLRGAASTLNLVSSEFYQEYQQIRVWQASSQGDTEDLHLQAGGLGALGQALPGDR